MAGVEWNYTSDEDPKTCCIIESRFGSESRERIE
jgi:hypothetical protein